ncbi:MAG: hypothetical protein GY757_50695, partial [bacterium]|nr:hypothetical protein [bacterium]
KLFLEAEEKQKKRQPQFPYLYSVQGFRYCDLLLGKGAFAEAMERAEKTLEWTKKYLGLLDVALDHLTLGRAWLQQAQQKESAEREKVPEVPGGDFARAGVFLDRAVAGLREAGAQEFLAKGLLARAAYYRHIRRYEKARLDLNESLDIAQSGCMKLFIVDYHLEMGKVERDVGKVKEAEEHFRIAGIIMAETGYKKRVPKVTKVN